MNEAPDRLPQPREGWRHYKGALYEIVGIGAHAETHEAVVVYQDYQPASYINPLLYVRPLNVFLGYVEIKGDAHSHHSRRFTFEREAPEPRP